MIVAGRLRRKTKITSTTRTTARPSSNSTSATEARIVVVRSVSTATSTAAGSAACKLRQQRLDAVDDRDDVGAGLALDVEDDRRHVVHPGGELGVLGAVHDLRDVRQPHRRAVPVGDDQVAIFVGALELVVGIDRVGARRPVEIALRRVDVGVGDRRAQIVDVEAVGGERARIGLDAHRRPLPAADADEADAGQLRDLLRRAACRRDPRPGSAAGSSRSAPGSGSARRPD